MSRATPFGLVERTLAWRYLRATRANGGVSVVSIVSFIGILLAVMALIVIMSVMSGFRATLLDAMLGGQGHVFVYTQDEPQASVDDLVLQIEQLPEVEQAMPISEQQVLATTDRRQSGAIVRGVRVDDLDNLPFLDGGAEAAQAFGFGEGKNGGDVIMVGRFLAADLGLYPGDKVTLIAPDGIQGPFGVTPRRKTYTVGQLFQTGSVELDQLYILMPVAQAQLFFGRKGVYDKLFGFAHELGKEYPEEGWGAMLGSMEPAQMRTYLGTMTRMVKPNAAAEFPPAADWIESFATYLETGGSIEFASNPPLPITEELIDSYETEPEPEEIVEIFGLTVTHTK